MENNENNNKRIEELTVDELMKVAQRKLKTPRKYKNKNLENTDVIKQFVVSENIKSHQNILVHNLVVYDRFNRWCLNNAITPIGPIKFAREFNKMFKHKIRKSIKYYLLHPEGFSMMESEQEAIIKKHRK